MEILAGIVSGVISSLGMGGGTVLIFLLSSTIGLEQHVAQATNLLFFIPTAIATCIINWKRKLIDIKLGNIIIIFGVLGAILGAKLATCIDASNLKKFFGVFLLIIAIYEIYTMIKEHKKLKKENTISKLR